MLRLLAAEREQGQRVADRVELVWTGPEGQGSRGRHTSVVVRELFASAERSVLVSTFAVYQGKQVFKPLAERMEQRPELRVRLFANVVRPQLDQTPDSQILREFVEDFRRTHWPGDRLPELYFDPRSLEQRSGERACLHAKCLVVDDRRSFVSSANFTEAAQERNIEAGVLIDDSAFAIALRTQFDALVATGALRRVPV